MLACKYLVINTVRIPRFGLQKSFYFCRINPIEVVASCFHLLKRGLLTVKSVYYVLQIWAWERLPRIAPRRLRDVGPGQGPIQDGDQQLPGGPWGSRY